jgi:hypothetical protein
MTAGSRRRARPGAVGRLQAALGHEPGQAERIEVGADGVRPLRDLHALADGRPAPGPRPEQAGGDGMGVGEQQHAPGLEDPAELGHRRQVRQVRQREGADRQGGRAVLDGKLAQVPLAQVGLRHALAGDVEHLGRAVHPDGLPPAGDQLLRVAPVPQPASTARRPAPGPSSCSRAAMTGSSARIARLPWPS